MLEPVRHRGQAVPPRRCDADQPDAGRLGKHPAVGVAEVAAVQLAKLGGLLGLSPVAERGLGTFTPPDDDNMFAASTHPR